MVIKYKPLDPTVRYVSVPWVLFVIFFLSAACLFKLTLFWSITNNSIAHESFIVENNPIVLNRGYLENVLQKSNTNLKQGTAANNGYKVVCYYTLDVISGQPEPTILDPYLCTHIIIAFAEIENCTIAPNNKNETKVYETVIGLKHANPSLNVLLSVGGPPSTGGFEEVVSSEDYMNKFINESLHFIQYHKLDGLDFDWEFPSWPKSLPEQKRNFTRLLKKFREEINKNGSKIIISVAVAAPGPIIAHAYDVAEMAEYVDFVNLMAYDYHMYMTILPLTGPNAPLYSRPAETGYLKTLNTNWSTFQWLSLGMPAEKLILGIPTFGHSFTLLNENNFGWNAPASGYGNIGQQGFVNYEEACRFISDPSTTHLFDDEYKVPYAYNGKEWISYENDESVRFKAYYIKDNKLGGAMIFSLNVDDYQGKCSNQQFPLTRQISNILTGSS